MLNEEKVTSLRCSVLPDVKWCRKSEVENGTVARLLGNCFWGCSGSSAVLLGAPVSEAEQGAPCAWYRRLWHAGLGVPGVLFQSYICCAKGSCQGTEVVMEFSSWGDSKKLQCMWNVIKEIKAEASVIILCGCQPRGDCSLQAESPLCEGASAGPFLPSAPSSAGHGWGSFRVLLQNRAGRWKELQRNTPNDGAYTYNLHYHIFRGHNNH